MCEHIEIAYNFHDDLSTNGEKSGRIWVRKSKITSVFKNYDGNIFGNIWATFVIQLNPKENYSYSTYNVYYLRGHPKKYLTF